MTKNQLVPDDGNQIVKRQLFVGIGVQKCATTWLYDILLDHPQVALSKLKELDFFSYHFGRGYQWYEEQFPQDRPGCLVGEISPSYFIDANVPERLQAYAPEAKLVVLLRDPVERAVSNHRHEVRLGNFHGDDISFVAGLANNPLYLEQSRYGTHLLRWLRHIPASRMLVLFQEDIDREPQAVAQQVYRFLDVDDRHVSNAVEGRSNESHVHRSRVLERARRAARDLVRLMGIDRAAIALPAFESSPAGSTDPTGSGRNSRRIAHALGGRNSIGRRDYRAVVAAVAGRNPAIGHGSDGCRATRSAERRFYCYKKFRVRDDPVRRNPRAIRSRLMRDPFSIKPIPM
ncbi:MAG: sulfotransferase domain-containing protein [Lamprocystis purpurea]|nr:sulfotransferase domain-containing protein [Lamprocystis purpurea]